MLKKNAAQRWWVRCIDGDTGYMATGQAASITATISKDSGSFVATNDTNPTEQSTSGYYYFDLTANETNATTVDIVSVHVSSKYRVEPLHGERFTSQLTATAVWDEAYSSHTTAGTFGKLMDILRKANTAIDGTVTAAATPTTLTFTTDLTDPTSTHKHQLLVFTSGDLEGVSRPIETYSVTNGKIVLQETLPSAPGNGDEFTILVQHVHPIAEIAEGVRSAGVGVRATQADDGTIVLYNGMTYDGTAHAKLSFTVTKDYSAADTITLLIHSGTDYDTVIKSAAAMAASTTLVEVTTLTATFSPALTYVGIPAVCELRYALVASYGSGDEVIGSGPLFVYQTPPTT